MRSRAASSSAGARRPYSSSANEPLARNVGPCHQCSVGRLARSSARASIRLTSLRLSLDRRTAGTRSMTGVDKTLTTSMAFKIYGRYKEQDSLFGGRVRLASGRPDKTDP